MDQIKIGRFIAVMRKEQNLTQVRLAEKLGITDRAVSKWETGRSMPDVSLMPELCEILGINVNELLSGERIAMKDYDRFAEENLISMRKEEEKTNKMLLRMETIIGFMSVITFFLLLFSAIFAVESTIWQIVMIAAAFMIFAVGIHYALKLERKAGYYKCEKCGHIYVPSWSMHMFAMHIFRTRYMKCPECQKWSWSEKILNK